jgi:hypothetical protein
VSRERVNSPDELRGGDRVELETRAGIVVVDLVVRIGNWQGSVVSAPPDAFGLCCQQIHDGRATHRHRLQVGTWVDIEPLCYAEGRVFIRRRSREDAHHQRVAESQR